MAVAFDAATSAQEAGGDGIISLSHTSTGSDLGGFAGQGNSAGAGGSATNSITWGGTAMTEKWDLTSGSFHAASGYTIAGQASGAQTVTATEATGSRDEQVLITCSFTGVDQTTPVGTAVTSTTNTSTPSVTVASVGADDFVVDFVYAGDGLTATTTAGANQTERDKEVISGNVGVLSTQDGADGGVMSWTLSGTPGFGTIIGAIAFKPSAAGANGALSSDGDGTLSAVGASIAAGAISSDGDASLAAVGAMVIGGAFNSAADAELLAVGTAIEAGALSAAADAELLATGASITAGALNADAEAELLATGAAIAEGVLNSNGESDVAMVGGSVAQGQGALRADGEGDMQAAGASIAAGVLEADGEAAATFTAQATEEEEVDLSSLEWARTWERDRRRAHLALLAQDQEFIRALKHLGPELMGHRRRLH